MSRNVSYILFGSILLITVILAVMLFQQGDLLRTGVVLNNDAAISDEATPPDEVSDDSLDPLEAHCRQVKAGHIQACGDGLPEEDFTCRTTAADAAYQTCLTTTNLDDLTAQQGSEETADYDTDL